MLFRITCYLNLVINLFTPFYERKFNSHVLRELTKSSTGEHNIEKSKQSCWVNYSAILKVLCNIKVVQFTQRLELVTYKVLCY